CADRYQSRTRSRRYWSLGGPRYRGVLRQLAHYASLRHLRLGVDLEAVERGDRAEGLLLGDHHVGRHIGHHGRLEKAAALGGALAAGDDFGTLLDGVGDVRLHLLDRLHVDQWPHHRTRLEPVGDLHRTYGLGEALGEGVV